MNCKKCHKEIPDGSLYCNYCGKKQEATKRKRAKRANGTGTIYCRSERKNPYIVYASSTLLGTHRIYVGSFPTYKKAQDALDRYNNDLINDNFNNSLTEIYDEWSKNHYKQLSKNGEQGYKTAYKYLGPIKKRKMRELKTADYQMCIDQCAEKYSRSQCEKVKQLCSQLCKYAMQNDIIDKNYAQFVVLPKAKKTERQIFTEDEIKLLWDHQSDRRVQLILIMCYSGLRIGELCDIKKANVDIHEHYIIGGGKTEAGTDRFIPINDKIYNFIVTLYNESKTERLINDNPSNFRKRRFYPALSELGIIEPPIEKIIEDKHGHKKKYYEYVNPRLTPHCTRHTFATLSQKAGVPPEALQKIIGHAKYETTAEIYIHEDREQLKAAIQKL